VTVAQLVAAVDPSGGGSHRTLRVERSGAVLAPSRALTELDLRSGDRVTLTDIGPDTVVDEGPDPAARPRASLRILTGPLAGQVFVLPAGTTRVGRASDNDLVLVDPGLSRHHATLAVDASSVVVTDLGATNGVRIEGLPIDGPTALHSGQRLLLGQSWVAIDHHPVPLIPVDGRVVVDRPQRLVPPYPGRTFQVPAPPDLGEAGGRLGPLASRMQQRQVGQGFERVIDRVVADLAMGRREEREARLKESPSIADVLLAVRAQTRLWERRVTDPDVLRVRLGLAELPTRHRVEVESGGAPGLRGRIDRLPRTYATIDGVPATVDLGRPGGLTLRGERGRIRSLAAALVGQLVGLNPPDQLGVVLFGDAADEWDWLKWLPHVDLLRAGRAPVGGEAVDLVARLLDAEPGGGADGPPRPPYVVVIVDDSAALAEAGSSSRGPSELVRLMAKGADRGLHPLLLADDAEDIPLAASGLFGATVTVGGTSGRLVVRGDTVQVIEPVLFEAAAGETLTELGRLLAPRVLRSSPPGPVAGATSDPDRPPDPGSDRVPDVGRDGLVISHLRLGPPRGTEGSEPADRGRAAPGEGAAAGDGTADLLDLPRSEHDGHLVLGSFRMPGDDGETILAFNPHRDGTLGLVGPPGAGTAGCLVTVAAATARIGGAVAELPIVYGFGAGEALSPLVALPTVSALAGDDPSGAIGVLAEVEQLMDDRLLTFELAGVDTFDEFRRARPGVALRRVLVLIDGLGRLADLLEGDFPGRTREVVGQLLELGSGLGLHLVFTVEDRGEVDPLLVPKVGRWLEIGGGPEHPGRVTLEGADVRFAAVGGSWEPESMGRGLAALAAELADRAGGAGWSGGANWSGGADRGDGAGGDGRGREGGRGDGRPDRSAGPEGADPAASPLRSPIGG
jgi:hypothetical protein